MRGAVIVIASEGDAYRRMVDAWLVSWQRQYRPGHVLIFVYGGAEGDELNPLPQAGAFEMLTTEPETLIPGVLNKTLRCLKALPPCWVFRTNLSSYVDLDELCWRMDVLPRMDMMGFSPHRDHVSGAGLGLGSGAVRLLIDHESMLDRTVIDDVAISRYMFWRGCYVVWTGRIDRVFPDGLVKHGNLQKHYHVRVKTLDRDADATVLMDLAKHGMSVAYDWF